MTAGKSPGLSSAENDTRRNPSFHHQRSEALNMSHLIRTPIYWVIMVLTVSFSALTFPLQARVQLDLVAKFQNVDIELYVVTVVDSEVEAESKVALLVA
jgi:hypothetical protein